jgi:hypothetical protein
VRRVRDSAAQVGSSGQIVHLIRAIHCHHGRRHRQIFPPVRRHVDALRSAGRGSISPHPNRNCEATWLTTRAKSRSKRRARLSGYPATERKCARLLSPRMRRNTRLFRNRAITRPRARCSTQWRGRGLEHNQAAAGGVRKKSYAAARRLGIAGRRLWAGRFCIWGAHRSPTFAEILDYLGDWVGDKVRQLK